MQRIYRNLPWLDSIQAVDYFKSLTGLQPGISAFIDLCKGFECKAYIHCCYFDAVKEENSPVMNIRLDGYYELTDLKGVHPPSPLDTSNHLLRLEAHRKQELYGELFIIDDSDAEKDEHQIFGTWAISLTRSHTVLFRPDDIDVLAGKVAGQPTYKELQQQLEEERAAFSTEDQRTARTQDKAKPASLLAIAGLLELLLDQNRRNYTQGSAAIEIEERHPDWRGGSESTLTKLFADAKFAAKEANKKAEAKTEAREAAATRLTKN